MKLAATTLGALALTTIASAAVMPRSGLHGTVMRGPISPVCIAGQPCSAPARNVMLSFTGGAGATTTTRTSPDGMYSIRLRPGRYQVSVSAGRIEPTVILVRRALFLRLNFSIDTGIR
jgi:hypothetical protein